MADDACPRATDSTGWTQTTLCVVAMCDLVDPAFLQPVVKCPIGVLIRQRGRLRRVVSVNKSLDRLDDT